MEGSFPGGRVFISEAFTRQGISPDSIGISIASIENSMLANYEVALKKWWNFCHSVKVDFYLPHIPDLILFLQTEFEKDRVKNSKKGTNQSVLYVPFYYADVPICPALVLQHYLNVTFPMRGDELLLFLTLYKGKKKAVCKQTLSNWVKNILTLAGVDSIFKAHSTRHSSNSAAKRLGTSIDLICKTAGWSKNSATFAKFHNREVVADQAEFALSIFRNHKN
ncbi:hypothetical protein TKK_0018233 [Trichogramma kaykai]